MRNIAPQHRVYISFFLYSLMLGAMFPRLGDLQLKMGISEGILGLALIGAPVGIQISLIFSGPILEKIGYRLSLLILIPFLGLAETLVTLMPTPQLFFFAWLLGGLAIGAIEVIVNLEADRTEYKLKRRIMNRSHAFWSFGFATAGLIGGQAAKLAISPTAQVFGIAVVVTVLMFVFFHDFVPAAARSTTEGPPPRFVVPTPGILILVACTLSAMLLEGAGIDWSVIFMRDTFASGPLINGLALSFGACSQGIVRYFADPFVDRLGPVKFATILLITLGVGTLTVTFSLSPAMALFGFALMGVGTSAIFPLAMSAAAQRTDRPAATNVAALAQLSFVMFLLGPPLLGFVAEHFGIRSAYGVGIPLVILSLLTVRSLAPK